MPKDEFFEENEMAAVKLTAAIDDLYQVFSRYRLASHVEGCPCCVKKSEQRKLYRRPLRELTGEDLDAFAFKTMTTWGGVDDFRHFLPRLFELSCHGDLSTDREILFGKLRYGEWETWPENEQQAINNFLHSFWKMALQNEFDPDFTQEQLWSFEECLCSIGCATDNIEPFLEIAASEECSLHFKLWCKWDEALKSPFWESNEIAHQRARNWLKN